MESSVENHKEIDSNKVSNQSEENSMTVRVILFDCDGRVMEFKESAVKLHRLSNKKVILTDLKNKNSYLCRTQKLHGVNFQSALILTTKESFKISSRKHTTKRPKQLDETSPDNLSSGQSQCQN